MVLCRRIAARLAMTIRRSIVVLVRDSIPMSSIEGNFGALNQIYFAGNSNNAAQGGAAEMKVSKSQFSFACPGIISEFSGARGRLNLYWFNMGKA